MDEQSNFVLDYPGPNYFIITLHNLIFHYSFFFLLIFVDRSMRDDYQYTMTSWISFHLKLHQNYLMNLI